MANYLFTLQPTFTQGLVLGQLSVFFLLALILKYLFWHTGPEPQLIALPPKSQRHPQESRVDATVEPKHEEQDESLEWFNGLLLRVVETYRAQLCEYKTGPEAEETIRRKVESKINELRPRNFIDHVKVHSVDIGTSSPRLTRARVDRGEPERNDRGDATTFNVSYRDSISISLSTSIVLHYPRPFFARLPIALTLSLVLFSSNLVLIPPDPGSETPCLTFTLPPDFTLEVESNSLLGSRAKLADVPKVHEMIVSQIRRSLISRGTWTIVLPRVSQGEPPPSPAPPGELGV